MLGDWTLTIKDEPEWTPISGGTGVTVSHSGTSTTMMEKSRNGDADDHRDQIRITLDRAPSEDIVILGRVDTQVRTGTNSDGTARNRAIARPNSPTASGDGTDNPGGWYVVTRVNNMITEKDLSDPDNPVDIIRPPTADELSHDVELIRNDNIVDSGTALTGNLEFRVVTVADSDDTDEFNYADNDAYTTISLPDVPLSVTDDDEITKILLQHAATKDKIATEGTGAGDTAKFRVTLSRALESGENLTVPLTFQGATLGTHFTLGLDGSPQGVTYADSSDATRGLVTFTGPSAA